MAPGEDDEVPECMAVDAVDNAQDTGSGMDIVGSSWGRKVPTGCSEKVIFNGQGRPVSIGCGSGFACKGTCKLPEFAEDAQGLQ